MAPKIQRAWERGANRGRRFGVIEPQNKILIVTEGTTEANYFENYKRLSPNNLFVIKDMADNKRSLVQKAIDEKDRLIGERIFDNSDHFWVVMDRDIQPDNPQDRNNYNAAHQLARNNGISIACSNDAFELWFVLHFQDLRSAVARSQLCTLLSGHFEEKYSKTHPTAYFEKLLPHRQEAIKRAKSIFEEADETLHDRLQNPSTTVHHLVELLIEISEPAPN
jgi:hypothetical protein